MQREAPTDTDGGYQSCPLIMESALELQQMSKWLPDTADLPTTHEHHVYTVTDARGLTVKHVGVRLKPAPTAPAAPVNEEDGLNKMTDADLETEAAKVGVVNYPKGAAKAKRVAMIREAKAKVA